MKVILEYLCKTLIELALRSLPLAFIVWTAHAIYGRLAHQASDGFFFTLICFFAINCTWMFIGFLMDISRLGFSGAVVNARHQ